MSGNIRRQKKAAIILFLIALFVRLTILVLFDHNRIPPDGVAYHRIAVNLVNGNGFSNQEEEPFEKYYFREPGYPVFLAGIYSIANIFTPVQYINYHNINAHKLDKYYPEIIVAKTVQILLDSFGIVLLFFILVKISNIKTAFLTGLIAALFFNLAFHSVYLLRESFVVFLLLVLNIFYIKYIRSEKKYLWLSLIGIIIGLLILSFQVHIVILPILFVLMLINSKNLKISFAHASMATIIAILITLPHLVNVYKFYPNIKILKTFGNSFTHELLEYNRTITSLYRLKLISKEEASKMREWGATSKIQFERSFNGYYSKKAASMKALVPAKYKAISYKMKGKMRAYFIKFRKSVFLTKIAYFSGKYLFNTYGPLILFPLIVFPALIGITGIIGLLFFWRKYLIYLLPFLVYLSFFWMLGSEYRRMIVLQPFLIFFGLLLINKILRYFGIHWFESNNAKTLYSKVNMLQFK